MINNKIITIKKRNHILQVKKYKNYVTNKYFIIKYGLCEFKCNQDNNNGCVLIVNTKKTVKQVLNVIY